jgi:hypothetical protein
MKAYILKKNVLVHDWAPHPVFMYTGFTLIYVKFLSWYTFNDYTCKYSVI